MVAAPYAVCQELRLEMPQVTVYIREDDLPIWKAIDKKSEFIHQALVGTPTAQNPKIVPPTADFKKLGITTADKLETYEPIE